MHPIMTGYAISRLASWKKVKVVGRRGLELAASAFFRAAAAWLLSPTSMLATKAWMVPWVR